MHIPDNYLSASTCVALTIATIPVWSVSVKKITREFPKERFSALGVAAAFSFLAMMFNVPLPGGTTGHAVGGVLLAILLGPEAACLSLTIALAIQALLFGDGGILAFGANCFNIACILPFSGYLTYCALRKLFRAQTGSRRDVLCVGAASYVGLNLAALAAAIQFGVQPLLFHTPEGQALFCPYPLSVSVPAMAIGHLTLFGLAEILFSVGVYVFVMRAAPGFAANPAFFAPEKSSENEMEWKKQNSSFNTVYILLAILVALTPLGLLAEGTAWGEWGEDEIASLVVNGEELGYVPQGMTTGFHWSALVPDYSAPGAPEWLSYVLSAISGVALSILVFKLATLLKRNDASA